MQGIKNIYHLFMALSAVLLYGYPAKKLTVIGVTGTDGKTTTSSIIGHILSSAGKKVGIITTVGAKIGDKKTDIGLHVTTPSPFTLQKLLKEMVSQQCEYAVIEATSHGLDQNRLFGCNFAYGVLTNITHEHLDYHKTLERYTKAKAKLFSNVKVSVLNKDDQSFQAMQTQASGKIVTYGMHGEASITPDNFPFSLALLGDYNKANALAAIAVCKHLGIADDTIRQALTTFASVEGRLEKVSAGQLFTVIVDFAHTPNAILQVLSTLREETKGKLITVFGSAGLRDITKRPISGEVAARLADVSIITADDPATENVHNIISQIVPGALKAGAIETSMESLQSGTEAKKHIFVCIPDRREAIEMAIRIAKPEDTVALLGKGHQKSFSQGKAEIPWNEKEVALHALEKVGYHGT